MNLKNDLLIKAAKGGKTTRPPVWLMRQAGRILPQYKSLRASLSGFKELVLNPELACQVTLQPIDELEVDAAIIFSDILVVPEAMGLPYEMIAGKGPYFPMTLQTESDVHNLLEGAEPAGLLSYVYRALELTKTELDGKVPLIGFCGAPWTLMAYMVEGSGSKTFSKARGFLYQYPELSHQLLDKITNTSIAYLKNQIKAGADVLQVFDSWAGILGYSQYKEFGIPYLKKICDAIDEVPLILFPKGANHSLNEISKLSCEVLSIDWTITPSMAKKITGSRVSLQGNLDPCLLYAEPERIKKETLKMLGSFGGKHIANLGHGVYPDTPLDNVRVFVDTVKEFRYSQKG